MPAEGSETPGRVHDWKEAGVGWIVLDNPGRQNAVTLEMMGALKSAAERFGIDESVRVVVVKGAGTTAFTSGGDVGQLRDRRTNSERPHLAASLAQLQKPVIAMIQGWCLGGGLLMALEADIRIASDDARFGIPAAKLGVGYPYESVEALVAVVGASNAGYILFTGERLDANAALRVGLVHRVIPKESLENTVKELAAAIVDNAPLTLRAAKASVRAVIAGSRESEVLEAKALVDRCFQSLDVEEGRAAFLEKRRPRFVGR